MLCGTLRRMILYLRLRDNKGDIMKIEMDDKWVQRALVAFLGLGACSYGCMFVTYVLWFMGLVEGSNG